MAIEVNRVGSVRPAPPGGKAATAVTSLADSVRSGSLAFYLFVGVFLVEYGGLGEAYVQLKAYRISTILLFGSGFLVLKKFGTRPFTEFRETRFVLAMFLFTIASVSWAVIQADAFDTIKPELGNLLFCIVGAYVVDSKKRIGVFAAAAAGLAIFLIVRNPEALADGMRQTPFRAGYFMTDGNEFAWGIGILACLGLHFALARPMLLKPFGVVALLMYPLAVLGTQSRGATLGLVPALVYYWMFVTRRKALAVVCVGIAGIVFVANAPSGYFNRMSTIADYEEDSSATDRLKAWGASVRMAIDYPLGVGANNFTSAYGRYYMGNNRTGHAAYRWANTHSIYFKTLGEFGFIGLGLLLTLIGVSIRDNLATRKMLMAAPGPTQCPPHWPSLVNMALVSWAISGAFLSGVNYPHLYLLAGLTVGARRMALRDLAMQPAAAPAPKPPAFTPARLVKPANVRPVPGRAAVGLSRAGGGHFRSQGTE
jgi:probable O-glycosylation ligase (exosortase A-associated)